MNPRPGLLRLLLGILAAEFLLVAGLVVTLVIELFVDTPASLASAIALLVIAVIAALWLAAIVVGAWRGRSWIRGAGLAWQVLQLGVGIASLQGAFAQPAWGWPLVIVAAAGILLLLSRPVTQALSERDGAPGAS